MAKHSQTAPSPIEVQKYLHGLEYPAQREEIIDKAEEEGADEDILALLQQLPDKEYESPVELSSAVAKLG